MSFEWFGDIWNDIDIWSSESIGDEGRITSFVNYLNLLLPSWPLPSSSYEAYEKMVTKQDYKQSIFHFLRNRWNPCFYLQMEVVVKQHHMIKGTICSHLAPWIFSSRMGQNSCSAMCTGASHRCFTAGDSVISESAISTLTSVTDSHVSPCNKSWDLGPNCAVRTQRCGHHWLCGDLHGLDLIYW